MNFRTFGSWILRTISIHQRSMSLGGSAISCTCGGSLCFLMVARFYFGSVWLAHKHLTNKVHRRGSRIPAGDFGTRSLLYHVHFITGIFHFALFFAWSLTVTVDEFHWIGFSPFFLFLELILLWDLWYLPWGFGSPWIWKNVITAAVGLLLWAPVLLFRCSCGKPCLMIAEAIAVSPALGVSMSEIGALLKEAFKEYANQN